MASTREETSPSTMIEPFLDLLCCPVSGNELHLEASKLYTSSKDMVFHVSAEGIPVFADEFCSDDARRQQEHYDSIAAKYVENLGYPHTIAYMEYLDDSLLNVIPQESLGTMAEICCGHGEAISLIGKRIERGVGVDISLNMLKEARKLHDDHDRFTFVQGDATQLPLASAVFDNVFMLGGIHHVNDREALFREIFRILKPGGRFYYREPLDDFFVWRGLRSLIYRFSSALDHETERPLRYEETVPVLEQAGLDNACWKSHGFLGFCFFMNSDVLVFNRLFRFIPGIGAITRFSTKIDEAVLAIPGLKRAGLQVVGVAEKPEVRS